MKVVICWPEISGYMAACWRALAGCSGVDLFVIALKSGVKGSKAAFTDDVARGLPCQLLGPDEGDDAGHVADLVAAQRPDIVVLPGWSRRAYMALTRNPRLSLARFVMGMDTPWLGSWRQRLARFWLRGYLRKIDAVVVPGERGWPYARHLGFAPDAIYRGLYGFDADLFHGVWQKRTRRAEGWPRRFVYVGRYSPEKGIADLIDAYVAYRRAVADPWPMDCCGTGPLAATVREVPGVRELGFIQPAGQAGLLAECGAFVLASRYEPWGVALAEAMGSGLPAICTEACGASVDLVRPFYNGLIVPAHSPGKLAWAMEWIHVHADRLPEMGSAAASSADAFGAPIWAQRWQHLLKAVAAQ